MLVLGSVSFLLLNDDEQIDAKAIREDESQVSWRDVLGTGFFGQYVGIIRVHKYMVSCHVIYIYGSRSKVLNKNFNLGGTQPTLLYDFTSSLCGVTQGNPAKHKLGARFAQGWRKCFHVLS